MAFINIRNPIRKRSKKQPLVSECDQLVRTLVLHRDGHRCVRCGGSRKLQAAHLKTKGRYGRIRFELLNVITLCEACHIFWWHRETLEAAEWLEQKYPGRIELLRMMAATAGRIDMKLLRIGLQIEVNNLS